MLLYSGTNDCVYPHELPECASQDKGGLYEGRAIGYLIAEERLINDGLLEITVIYLSLFKMLALAIC